MSFCATERNSSCKILRHIIEIQPLQRQTAKKSSISASATASVRNSLGSVAIGGERLRSYSKT
ncbi:unnamed protein product [Prunus armeniaca]